MTGMPSLTSWYHRVVTVAGKAIALAICEPQVRLGRRRHDGLCDRCGDPIEMYAAEKLRAMWDAEYLRFCLECSAQIESEDDEEEEGET